jgi:pyruvate dehydrogenase E1 component alpha subunit
MPIPDPDADALRLLAPDGELLGEAPIGVDETRRLYREMVAARLYDRKAVALQRQGMLATYAPLEGQEAAQVGSAAAVRRDDWMVPSYRDAAATHVHGYPFRLWTLWRMGDERGGRVPDDVASLPPSITVGGHMLHAVGLAWAELLAGRDRLAITYFGDGATSEGDFHEAANFAGVLRAPVVFVCQNNGFAISTPLRLQTAAESIAAKAAGYGMPGVRVDGNDLFAMHRATAEAVARARAGGGPTLIEAVTYRLGPHTLSDDPRRYREAEEEARWRERDPIERVRRYLERQGAWDPEWERTVWAEEGAAVEDEAAEAVGTPPQEPGAIFEAMFAEMTPQLREQRRALLDELAGDEG